MRTHEATFIHYIYVHVFGISFVSYFISRIENMILTTNI